MTDGLIITPATRLSHDAANLPYGCVVSTLTDDVSRPYAVTEIELVFPPELRGVAVRKVFLLSGAEAPAHAERVPGDSDSGFQCLVPDHPRAHSLIKDELSRLGGIVRNDNTAFSTTQSTGAGSTEENPIEPAGTCTVTWATYVCTQEADGTLTNCYLTELEFICDDRPPDQQLEPITGWDGRQSFDPCGGLNPSPYCWTDEPPSGGGGVTCVEGDWEAETCASDYWSRLNDAEKLLCLQRPTECRQVWLASTIAQSWVLQVQDRRHEPCGMWNDPADALRHAKWSAELTLRLGSARAEVWGTAHETPDVGETDPYVLCPIERDMDMHNNAVGRAIAHHWPDETNSKILEAMNNGTLWTWRCQSTSSRFGCGNTPRDTEPNPCL